ncbi:hypothetical protein, unlikely [Trypanosoma congolense IL3000]|uniref:Uncharacterized protein n=1 Tax=Trypanosoma congolense (strain IL3000) TaxID=1068625 RepID=F9WB78_TRYCI|nr:hypothetical protein, unlikely [Trypanosoma congolense IL3000]
MLSSHRLVALSASTFLLHRFRASLFLSFLHCCTITFSFVSSGVQKGGTTPLPLCIAFFAAYLTPFLSASLSGSTPFTDSFILWEVGLSLISRNSSHHALPRAGSTRTGFESAITSMPTPTIISNEI